MGLSSNILWHQTPFDALKTILRDHQLRFAYSLEKLEYSTPRESLTFAYPMISICDLPFSEMGEYIGRYGDCCIGFYRQWAEDKQFCPVWYCSPTAHPLTFLMRNQKVMNSPKGKDVKIKNMIYNQLAFMKNIEGPLPKKNYEIFRFYDEREYRLTMTPAIWNNNKWEDLKLYMTEEEYAAYKDENGSSLLPPDFFVNFEYDDIYCIVVKDHNQQNEIRELYHKIGIKPKHIFLTEEIETNFIGRGHNKKVE